MGGYILLKIIYLCYILNEQNEIGKSKYDVNN